MSNPTELPDLGIVNRVRAAGYEMAASEYQHAWNLAKGGPGLEDRITKSENEFLAAVEKITARRAQPEGEAPQADDENIEADAYIAACDEMERWQKKRAKARLEIGTEGSLVDGIGWLYGYIEKLEATATLSPLCGVQHAESGKESILPHEAIEVAVDQCYPKQDSPHASVNDKIGAARLAFRKGYRAALAAQQAAAPDGNWLWSKLMDWCKKRGVAPANYDDLFAIVREARAATSVPGTPEAPTHCDPAEGFCKACREQERAAQLDDGQEGSGS